MQISSIKADEVIIYRCGICAKIFVKNNSEIPCAVHHISGCCHHGEKQVIESQLMALLSPGVHDVEKYYESYESEE